MHRGKYQAKGDKQYDTYSQHFGILPPKEMPNKSELHSQAVQDSHLSQ